MNVFDKFGVHIVDIKDMPDFDPKIKNQVDSVSKGLVYWHPTQYAVCRKHGAMLCVSKDRRIWRCPACNVGCYVWRWGIDDI